MTIKRSGVLLVIVLGLFFINLPPVYADAYNIESVNISRGQLDEAKLFISGGTMRKQIVDSGTLNPQSSTTGELNIINIATVQLTSEDPVHPIENAFNHQQGKGVSYWAAATSGPQTITLIFDQPQVIRKIQLEIEEVEVNRTQVLQISVSYDGGQSFEKVLQQDYTFSSPGTTFQHEDWTVNLEPVTHFRLHIVPDRDHNLAIAKLSSLILSSEN
ncbi:MAG: hypothetical protein RI580_18225 [Halothece sp. Uz-M2-17]|nr:hypothetical protein [Halothece sp. Uz-M2-17]